MKQHRVSTLSVNELDRAQRSRLQQHMRHDELACTAGVANAFVTAILAFRWPMHFWLWHLVKTFVLVPWRYVRFKATKSEIYLLDWCYVVSWLINGLALFAVLVNGAEYGSLNRELVRAGFAMASGPLAWSVFVFRNSLVFHDVDNMTSVFIHLSPALLFWCIRWGAGMGPGVVNAHWHLFDVCDDYAAADACVQSPDGEPNFAGWLWCDACPAQPAEFLVYPALVYVFGWSIPYFVIILWWLGPWIERSGKEILYDYFKKVQPALCEWFEMRLGPIVGVRLAPRLGYMFLHFVSIIGFGATSFFLWHSFLLHTLFMVWLTLVAVHNGSTYSFRNFAFRYAQKKLNEHPECAE